MACRHLVSVGRILCLMIYCLYGEDSFRRGHETERLLSEFRAKQGSIGVERFSISSSAALDDLVAFLKTSSLFSAKKLALIDSLDAKELDGARHVARLRETLREFLESKEVFIVFSLEAKPTRQFALLLEPPVKTYAFEPLDARGVAAFAIKEALLRGVALDPKEAVLLAELFGSNLWAVSTELDRLALALDRRLDARAPVHEYFKLAYVLKNGQSVRERLVALEFLLSELREDPARIFNGLAYGRPANAQAARQIGARLAEYDVSVKSGRLEYEEALLDLALSL